MYFLDYHTFCCYKYNSPYSVLGIFHNKAHTNSDRIYTRCMLLFLLYNMDMCDRLEAMIYQNTNHNNPLFKQGD